MTLPSMPESGGGHTPALVALDLVDRLLAEAGFTEDSSARHNLAIARSCVAELVEPAQREPEQFRCEYCTGGRWESECCNGSSGCSCGGQPVDMGACRVCGGSGWRTADADTTANLRSIQGLCYLGSGPR